MRPSESEQLSIRGIQYHCRIWGQAGRPKLFLLHGFQDLSASWQFTVDALQCDWQIIAPDWRGYGLSAASGADSYWFPDLVADLDALLEHFQPELPVTLVGHSMGASVAAIYAGVVPARVAKFVNIEGIGGPPSDVEDLPRRYARWLQQLGRGVRQRPYFDFADFAGRMISENPRLTPERAEFLVHHLGEARDDGSVWRRADPAHMQVKPTVWRVDEAMACWRRITAPTLWVEGAESRSIAAIRGEPDGYEARLAAFQSLADVVRVEQAGHNVHHDQPEALAAAIEGFV